MSPTDIFRTRDEVEVTSDDDGGGRTAYYEAWVVRSLPKVHRYTVEYRHLHDGGDDSRPLRATVDAHRVRPRLPWYLLSSYASGSSGDRRNGRGRFSLHQSVEAFSSEAWRVGVVSRLPTELEKSYAVRFPTSREELRFSAQKLRPHLERIDGRWVRPEAQTVEVKFKEGEQVEVSSDEDGFSGAWFRATVIELIGKDKFLVEYHNLMTEDESEFLEETVDSHHIRPTPPEVPVTGSYKCLEEVDAFYNDGWWEGVVSKVLQGGRYVVYFRGWIQEMEFEHHDLRLHFDWTNGRWIRTQDADT